MARKPISPNLPPLSPCGAEFWRGGGGGVTRVSWSAAGSPGGGVCMLGVPLKTIPMTR